ncbi:MAG TPA: DUF3293 domain-containing protein [Pyrinomonadaceae bacterium]|nr:DUF3293 domain-containing protein [Pyrinomonadaceae bacterium]
MDEARRKAMEAVYRATDYVVRGDVSTVVIRIGERCPAVDDLLGEARETWAFMTAWNPYSQELPAEENARRQNELIEELNAKGLRFFHGAGEDPNGAWPAEESLLVLGIDRDSAIGLAEKFEQNAIVFGRRTEPAELVWCI